MRNRFIFHVLLPTLLTVALFAATIFLLVVPAMERSILERKREMIRELTTSAWNILASLEEDVTRGKLSREEAQQQAVRQIRNLHYGPAMKDYFWVNDLQPRMVVHPYRYDLEGRDLSEMRDPDGKPLFVEFVRTARAHGEGFVAYRWQWKDDPTRILPKISFVKLFEPWGWVIGTGVYLEDVRQEVRATTRRLVAYSAGILGVIAALLAVILRHSLRTERARLAAEEALRESEERYRHLVESAGESIIMAMGGQRLYANANALRLLGYTAEEFAEKRLGDIIELSEEERQAGERREESFLAGRPASGKREARLIARSGATVPVLASYSPVSVRGQDGLGGVSREGHLRRMPLSGDRHGRNHIRGHAQAVAPVVQGDVACDQPEVRSERDRPAEGSRARQLSHGVDLASQAQARDGPSGPRQAVRRGGGRRDVRWRNGGLGPRTGGREEGPCGDRR